MFQELLAIATDPETTAEKEVMNPEFWTYRIRGMPGLVRYYDISSNRHALRDLHAANLRKWII
jgi:hypothetical protein